MHKTVYMVIPAAKIAKDTSKEHIDSIVEEVLAPYCGEYAEEGQWHMDWYEVGGRWAGFSGVKKGCDCYPTENGLFGYELFDKYDVLCNKGQRGPYVIDGVEYIPIIGAKKKDIEWDCVGKFDSASMVRYMQIVLDEEERNVMLGGNIPDGFTIEGDCLYVGSGEEKILAYKKGESFADYSTRREEEYGIAIMPPDAYVDKLGKWHDDNEIWENHALMSKLMKGEGSPDEKAMEAFVDQFHDYLKNQVNDDDYFLVVDTHN